MTKFGETHHFAGVDFVEQLEASMGCCVDGIIYNSSRPPADITQKYLEQKAEFVVVNPDNPRWKQRDIQKADLIDISGGVVRHDSGKLAAFIRTILIRKLSFYPEK